MTLRNNPSASNKLQEPDIQVEEVKLKIKKEETPKEVKGRSKKSKDK